MNRETATPTVRSMPGERAREWAQRHHQHAAPSTYVYDFVWDPDAAAVGPFCTDIDGNVLMDFTSHVGAAPLGYNDPEIVERLREFDLVDPLTIAGQDFYVSGENVGERGLPGPTELMERLTEHTAHYGLDTVFLSNSGAEAVENAIKISYDHTRGRYGITFEGAFHGRTLGALSLNRSKAVHRRRYPELAGVHELPFCTDTDVDTEHGCGCGFFTDDGSKLRTLLDPERGHVAADEVAYLIVEPVQGEGGYRIPNEAFMSEIEAVCAEHDLLLVADEIQAGVGRTGEMWGSDHFSIEPDIIASAKALRVGATISRSEVFPDEQARISSTWGAGDILSAAQGVFTLEAIEERNLLRNATERGRQARERLEDADIDGVVDVRGIGLMLAVEFETKQRREKVIEAALKRGLLTLGCGHKTLRLLPPLNVTEREIDLACDLLVNAASSVRA
ncbi:aminotransferase class III-fold pyridoxal phosphate-dependent enzyme [Halocatena pleomorpha]|uniref:Aminotransferase class III-fold pyridoxal phosphate-dependent enzyme n=1 Tax=Halocatena pleomorpha TaxID=1785090 RepID=A0A3P3RCE8_9EURY|nr:aminotransferase class III-fold pyridoxal phosphate-dependent enzyme [Halocatena pleomorpha]RRJ31141.1 aminotransferase class III-fold pyridoxal phosphate-dependent enzyme [Halocatena pleomorpha]